MCKCSETSFGKDEASATFLFQVERVRFPSAIQPHWVGSATTTVTGLLVASPGLRQKRGAQEAPTGHWKGQHPWRFGREPNSSVIIRRDVESDWLKENVSVTYERPVATDSSPDSGYRLGSSAKTWICIAPAAYLYSCCDQRQLDAIITCQCALAHLVTLEVDWSL